MSVASSGPPSSPSAAEAPVYFLGDAHLGIESGEAEAAKTRDLLAVLSFLEARASYLYIVGDLFDFWFEYPRVVPREHSEVLGALRALSDSGTTLRFLGGNHDYWAGSQFEEITGATVHCGPLEEEHFGRLLFVAHGDGLPQGDLGYRMLKAVIRSRPAISAFRLLGPVVGAAIARRASSLSDITDQRILRAIPPMKEFLESVLDAGYDAAIVGHVHRQMIWSHGSGTAVVVGDWMKHRSVIELAEGGFRPLRWVDDHLEESVPATP